jgi:hypothetical protein
LWYISIKTNSKNKVDNIHKFINYSELKPKDLNLQNTVLIDFANHNRKLKNLVRLYIPLSNSNDLMEIM